MAYRFTSTEKWQDAWFTDLSQLQKLLFIFLCDSCDIAGFVEVNIKLWAFHLGSTPDTIKGALEGLQRGLIISDCQNTVFIKNFLKHQKNLPLNPEKNPAHRGIVKKFEENFEKFNIQDITEFFKRGYQGATEGLGSPIGKGKGKGKGNYKEKKEIFENFRNKYPGTKRGFDVEFSDFKKHKNWEEVISILPGVIEKQISFRKKKKDKGEFVPEWKNLKTWLNQKCWTEEIPEEDNPKVPEYRRRGFDEKF